MAHILVVGAGAFGSAMAACVPGKDKHVTLISRHNKNFAEIKANTALHNCTLQTFSEFNSHFSDFDLIILAVPCQSLRSVSLWMKEKWREQGGTTIHAEASAEATQARVDAMCSFTHEETETQRQRRIRTQLNIACVAKGIECGTLLLPSQILQEVWQDEAHIATISGPSFAKEMLEGLPTCVVAASQHVPLTQTIAKLLHSRSFRIYNSQDVIGVEVGGALKNVIAMVAGAVDGLKLGHNARAAVMTRGLAEIAEIGAKLGADPITFLGLSGVGDLILTCTGNLSRNRQFGFRLALGESQEEIIRSMGEVIEGVATTQSAFELAQKLGIETSILKAAYEVLYKGLPISQTLDTLMCGAQGSEFDWAEK